MIVCIPSKNRPNTKTYKLFSDPRFQVFHFVEPQDLMKYKEIPNLVNIEKNDGGITYVRNFILDWAKSNKIDKIIVCDDDVIDFVVVQNKRCVKQNSANIWFEIDKKTSHLPFEIIGMNYTQYAWAQTKEFCINTQTCEVCVLLRVDKINWKYRCGLELKEDRDFALQTLKYGHGILKFHKYGFDCPSIGTNEGGLYDEYKAGKDTKSSMRMAEEWKPFVELVKKENRLDIKLNMKEMAKHYGKITK